MHLSGCTLHLVHIAAEKAANVLPAAIEEILIDIYYYFKKSSKRQDSLGMFQDMYDIDQKKMIKHVATRWLSIDRCLKRLLDNWVALKEYFTNENDQFKKQSKSKGKSSVNMLHKKLEKIADFLRSPTNKLYTMFLLCAHATFATFLTVMQAEEPKIHVLQSNIRSLERTILSKFIKPSAITNGPSQVDYRSSLNHKENNELIIGENARDFIVNKDKNRMKKNRISEFYESVKRYYVTALQYIQKNCLSQTK